MSAKEPDVDPHIYVSAFICIPCMSECIHIPSYICIRIYPFCATKSKFQKIEDVYRVNADT